MFPRDARQSCAARTQSFPLRLSPVGLEKARAVWGRVSVYPFRRAIVVGRFVGKKGRADDNGAKEMRVTPIRNANEAGRRRAVCEINAATWKTRVRQRFSISPPAAPAFSGLRTQLTAATKNN